MGDHIRISVQEKIIGTERTGRTRSNKRQDNLAKRFSCLCCLSEGGFMKKGVSYLVRLKMPKTSDRQDSGLVSSDKKKMPA